MKLQKFSVVFFSLDQTIFGSRILLTQLMKMTADSRLSSVEVRLIPGLAVERLNSNQLQDNVILDKVR